MGIIACASVQRDGSIVLPKEITSHLSVKYPDDVTISIDGDSVIIHKRVKEIPVEVRNYLTKGYDRLAAEYLASKRKRLEGVNAQFDYTLILVYEKNEKRLFDCKPLMAEGGLFSHLQNYGSVFSNAYIEDNAVCWNIVRSSDGEKDTIRIDADTCYIKSVLACVLDLTREEMLEAKMASLAMGVDLEDEEGIAGFVLARRAMGHDRRK